MLQQRRDDFGLRKLDIDRLAEIWIDRARDRGVVDRIGLGVELDFRLAVAERVADRQFLESEEGEGHHSTPIRRLSRIIASAAIRRDWSCACLAPEWSPWSRRELRGLRGIRCCPLIH